MTPEVHWIILKVQIPDVDATIARFDISSILLAGINENSYDIDFFTLFPNPTDSYIVLQLEKELKFNYNVVVTDALGRVIINEKYEKTQKIVKFDTQHLSNGMYFIQVISPEMHASRKFIKSK